MVAPPVVVNNGASASKVRNRLAASDTHSRSNIGVLAVNGATFAQIWCKITARNDWLSQSIHPQPSGYVDVDAHAPF